MTAVSVWDHRPSAGELLDDRLARGWTPTPTATVLGPRVLGYAACRIDRESPVQPPTGTPAGGKDPSVAR